MTVPEDPARDSLPSPGAAAKTTEAHDSLVSAWRARVARNPDAAALRYFDGVLSARDADAASDALAAAFEARGTRRGDRVGVYLQNVPQYALVLLALWKLGATALGLNPMYRRHELRRIVDDAAAVGIVCADTDVEETLGTLAGSTVRWLISTSALDYQSRDDPRVFTTTDRPAPAPDGDLVALIEEFAGSRPAPVRPARDDVAFLTYTSGTTGPPKGAMNTHGNVLSVVESCRAWTGLGAGDVVLAVAPLFHITGAVVNAAIALLSDATLVLAGRFRPEVVLDAFAEHGVTFTVGSITAYNALYALPHAKPEQYWGRAEATAQTMPAGRLRTGDVAIVDAEGWVYLVDRLKDQINVSGYKVWPREVEDVLYEHPAVLEAAVVGRPDAYRGETVVAYVSLRSGRSATQDELIAFSRERLAAYKCPRQVHFIADLPKTQSGKIRRARLRDAAAPARPSGATD
ncbi:AMP-binding protein [Streptomyces sp. 2-6]|uniref:AMP-binding protein n=1 Tax=Streptomyces sp. 2-6 TaxID=2978333 RepID=UPI003D1512AA